MLLHEIRMFQRGCRRSLCNGVPDRSVRDICQSLIDYHLWWGSVRRLTALSPTLISQHPYEQSRAEREVDFTARRVTGKGLGKSSGFGCEVNHGA